MISPQTHPLQPVIALQIMYPASNPFAAAHTAAFHALSPIFETTIKDIEYHNLYENAGTHAESPICRKGDNLSGFPSSFSQWDPAAMRAGFELFSEITANEKFASSAYILESYGRDGVEAVPDGENAVAPEERALHLLASPLLWWAGNDEEVKATAEGYGDRIRKATMQNKHAYLNYAVGDESLEDVYGARLERLRALKKVWDPENKFGFYIPIR